MTEKQSPTPASWAPQVIADNSGHWCGNGLRFATEREAIDNACDLMRRWVMVTATRAMPSADPVNYTWTAAGLSPVQATPEEPHASL